MKVLHLYPNLMNLYGERANPLILYLYLKNKGIQVTVEERDFGDEINFKTYDVVYIGSGLESNRKQAVKDLFKYREEILELIESGVIFLATGNSFEIFGRNIYSEASFYKSLGIFDFETSEQSKKRFAFDVIFETEFCAKPIIGSINKCTEIHGIEDHFFKVNFGFGDFYNSEYEGIRKYNFFGTHITGPILVRNPYFLENFLDLLLKRVKGEEVFNDKKREISNTGILNKSFETYVRRAYELTLLRLKTLEV
ncbi:MAG: hypothetical protein LBI55_01805 [Oscillospiraceae bacterium]|jgi:CobQ-like glutamine amidotransferase family enzyme|nr:hypothetical protein [Oscillospiraceae bacterium]